MVKLAGDTVGVGAQRLVERLRPVIKPEVTEERSGLAGMAKEHRPSPQ
jgi:hypothetical protein